MLLCVICRLPLLLYPCPQPEGASYVACTLDTCAPWLGFVGSGVCTRSEGSSMGSTMVKSHPGFSEQAFPKSFSKADRSRYRLVLALLQIRTSSTFVRTTLDQRDRSFKRQEHQKGTDVDQQPDALLPPLLQFLQIARKQGDFVERPVSGVSGEPAALWPFHKVNVEAKTYFECGQAGRLDRLETVR
jgi:hypothetical protein